MKKYDSRIKNGFDILLNKNTSPGLQEIPHTPL